jgi:hypothetical protein
MKKRIQILIFLLIVVILPTLGCSSQEIEQKAPQATREELGASLPEKEPVDTAEQVETVSPQVETVPPQVQPVGTVEVVATIEIVEKETTVGESVSEVASDSDKPMAGVSTVDSLTQVETEVVDEDVVRKSEVVSEVVVDEKIVTETDVTERIESVPFTATTGLDTFSTYRMNFITNFDGTRQGQPSAGNLEGMFEVTQKPKAQHWRIVMTGNAFAQLAALSTMELYDINNVIYIKNPGDGSWIGVPADLVKSMLPTDMYKPEDNIDLPVTAVPQSGQEMVNGVLTQRYTFGPTDLADGPKYDEVMGTIWVAVDGDYVVKYEATISGQFDSLSAGGIDLMDEGTITMMYDVSDVNKSGFTIDPPPGAKGLDLSSLLSGLGKLK